MEFKYVSSVTFKVFFSIFCMINIKYIYLHIRIVQNITSFSPILRNFAEVHWTACLEKDVHLGIRLAKSSFSDQKT